MKFVIINSLVACGIYSICGGVFDWDFFMNSREAKPSVDLLGRDGARIFYIVLGIISICFGFAVGIIF